MSLINDLIEIHGLMHELMTELGYFIGDKFAEGVLKFGSIFVANRQTNENIFSKRKNSVVSAEQSELIILPIITKAERSIQTENDKDLEASGQIDPHYPNMVDLDTEESHHNTLTI